MPINMRAHGHGQGYTDLNFIIPESIHHMNYQKGAYYAEVGDFSGAGSAQLFTSNRVEHGIADLTVGENSFSRLALLNSLVLRTIVGFMVLNLIHMMDLGLILMKIFKRLT